MAGDCPEPLPAIRADALTKRFDSFTAVDALSFDVATGEVFGLLGSNGAGKTTTIHMMTGLLEPSAGRVLINGTDIEAAPLEIRRQIGYLPEFPALYERLTGAEYLRLIGRLRGMREALIQTRLDELSALLGLHGRLDSLTGNYSRGMQQKLAIIAAVLHDPDLYFLDEPTANLDPRYSKIVKDLILDAKQRCKTIVLSTHLTQIAEEICDRVLILDQGTIRAIGTTATILNQTRTGTLEQAFISVINHNRANGGTGK